MTTYILTDRGFVDKRTGEPMALPQRWEPVVPQYMRDVPEYASPIDGRMITSRSHRREDLKRNDCVEAGDMPRKNAGLYRNKDFARKHRVKWEGHQ